MPQANRSQVRRHVDSFRHDPARLFDGLLDSALVAEALVQERVHWRDCVFTPCITLWTFLGQVLCPDHSCRAAVARLLALLSARGEAPCSPETGPYCKARQRLPLGLLSRLTHRTGQLLEQQNTIGVNSDFIGRASDESGHPRPSEIPRRGRRAPPVPR